METQKKFQNKRLNKDDHKNIEKAAKGIRIGGTIAAVAAGVGIAIKKYGIKPIIELAKNTLNPFNRL